MKRSERTFVKHLFGAKVTKAAKIAKGNSSSNNKQDLSAGNHSLRLPALRPCLLGMFLTDKNSSKIRRGINSSNLVKSRNHKTIISALTIISIILPGIIIFGSSKSVSAASLTLSIPDNISVSINTQNGITYKESDKSNITIKTDAYAGYTLNIKSTDETNVLKSSDGKTINSIESSLDDYQASGAINSWAFLPGKLNGIENNTYQPGPKTDILLGKSSISSSGPDIYPISIATKIDGSQPTGVYKNSFTITATANPVPYEITYNYNNGTGNITPNPQTGTGIEGGTIKLSDETPTRSNYEFLGWCDAPTDNEECNGNKYEKGVNYTLKNNDNKFVLYSIWKPFGFEEAFNAFGKQKQDGYYKMQDMTPEICNAIIVPDTQNTYTLIDIRDNNTYNVSKLADDRCWMTENLRIVGKNITSADSDVTDSYTIPSSGLWIDVGTNTNGNHAYYNNNTSDGAYYTWYTATASTGISSMTTQGQNALSSICPKGWKLPTGSPGGDFQTLIIAYDIGNDGSKLTSAPLNFTYAGYVYYTNGWVGNQGNFGRYWSSTVYDSLNAYSLRFVSNEVDPIYDGDRPGGYSVRCVARR